MKLILDFGNTYQKLAVFRQQDIIHFQSYEGIRLGEIQQEMKSYPHIQQTIMSSVIEVPREIIDFFIISGFFILLDHTTPLPIALDYDTPETLGKDRIASAVAAIDMFPDKNLLVIDAGTCITYDLITADKTFRGGSINPGIDMRYRALHTLTGKLPLESSRDEVSLTGRSTRESIMSGVLNATCIEMYGIIKEYKNTFPDLQVVLTGGDMNYFDKKLKSNIFAVANLVLKGLNIILEFNVKQ